MYAELKCKSNFSFLRGASDSREYISRASELGINAVGITDVNGVYALPRAFEEQKHRQNVKLIAGAELTLKDHPPLTLLARDRAAYGVLCRLITTTHQGKEKGEAMLQLSELITHLERPESQGLIALPDLTEKTRLDLLKELFPKRLYLPLCRYLDGLDETRTRFALEHANAFALPIIAHNDVHYALPTRRRLQDCLTAIREGTTVKDAGFKLFGNDERHLKTPLQMRALFRDLPSAIQSTLEISESCSFQLSQLSYTYPRELIPTGFTEQEYFEKLVYEGAHLIYRGLIPLDVEKQIRHEIALIKKMNYAAYFLTIHDIVHFARSQNIICQGRGSAANSICCYVLGITPIDPVRMNLLFERFISENRAEPPDIDVDFEHERREEVIQYVYARYGRERAGMISAVRTYQSRSAFLEISKAVGIPVGTISAQELERNFESIAGEEAHKRPVIEALVAELTDFPRHLSIHSGGFTLSEHPIIETVPIEPARMVNRTIIQWDKNDLDTVGLLKVDLLALGFLTALHKICDLIGMDRRNIPAEDKKTYDMICAADTEGTFQIESRAQRSMLPKTMPRNFYDLVVQVAIVRPGPSVGEMVHPYIQRRMAERRGVHYRYHDEVFKKILSRTYGVPIFQEQVMKLAIECAGFTPSEADQLRRSLASFREVESVDKIAERFFNGLIQNGVHENYAKELFSYLKGYAHYGFPESHAASFAIITYQSAYLKCHYPAEFLCGLINSQPMGFYSVDSLIQSAKRSGVTVLPLDPRYSMWDATMETCASSPKWRAVRMGFGEVRGLSKEAVTKLIEERERKPFQHLQDFLTRSGLPRAVLETLALGDAFRCFGHDQRLTLWSAIANTTLIPEGAPQASFEQMTLFETMRSEHEAFSYSTRGNIMMAIRAENPNLPKCTSRDLKAARYKKWITLSGVTIVMQRPPTAKGACFITLEDEFGTMDLILRKEVYEKYRDIITTQRLIVASGQVQIFGVGRSLQVNKISEPAKKVEGRNLTPGGHPRSMEPF